jgi:hypothetical protein
MKSKRNRRGKIFLAALLTMAMFLSMVSPSMGANGTGGIAGSADPGINAGLAVADTPAKVTASSTDIATVNSADSVTAEIPELKTLSSKAAGLLKAAPELNLEGPLLSSLAFGTTTAGTGLTCTEEFSSEKAEYKLVFPTAAASNLCIKPQMANSTDYKWRWIAVNNSTNVVTKSASALAFPAATGNTAVRIGTTTIAVGTTVTIDIVASGNDEEVLNSYTIVVLPQGTLTGLTVKYSTASANSTLSPTFNALTYSYSATINMASASGTINITPTGAGKEIKVNGQSATNGQAFSLSPADLFADGDSAVVTIDVGGAAENNLFEPHTYTLTLRKPTSVTAALGYISQLAVFESGTAPQYQVTTSGSSAVVSDAPVRYSWYINTENSIDSATPIDGATVNTYRPDVTDFDPGVYYHFAKVTSESGKSWTSDPIKLVVVPKVNPTIVTTNQPDLPKIEGVTYPEGVTKGYYYSESVEAKEYESFGVTPSFLGQIYDLTAPPYNCTFNYSWRRINASTGVTVYLSSEKGPTIKPISILGGWKYYCDVTYSISVDGASPLTSAAYPSETFYVHVQDPAVNEATEKQLSDLEISYVSDLRMEQNADCEPAFSPTTTEYVLAPNGFPNALYVNPKMENSENYRWIYTIAEIDGDIEVNSVKREFGSLTRLSWSNSAITVFPNYVNAGSYYGGLILKIKIVGAGDDDTIYGSYTVSLRERRFLSRIELKDSDGNDMPLLESGKYTSLSNATRDYSVLVDTTKESFTITPTTLSN